MHRNNVVDAKGALSRLSKPYNKNTSTKDELPTYTTENNVSVSKEEADELLKLMGKKWARN